MSIRMGDSALTLVSAITPQARAVEARSFFDFETEWIGIADKCIKEKKYSITTVCLAYHTKNRFLPTEARWREKIEVTVRELLYRGGNWNNCRIDIINEPIKHVENVEQYLWLEHVAHDQINGRLPMGSGCEELIYDGWQSNIVSRGKAEYYVIHIQASCDSKARTDKYVKLAYERAVAYKKILTCNEGNYKDVSSNSGFDLMKYQMRVAENYGCKEYLNVFNNLVRRGYDSDTRKWDFLSFKIDGAFRNKSAEANYNEWICLMDTKAPIPNIIEIIIEDDDMKLPLMKVGVKSNAVAWLQECLEVEYGFENSGGYDGAYGTITEGQVEQYQTVNKLTVDGICGKNSVSDLINNAGAVKTSEYWMNKLTVFMAYEK